MDKEKVLNLGLVFDVGIARKLEEYSQYLNEKLPGTYILGEDSLPHISVLQFLTEKTADKIWEVVEKFAEHEFIIEFDGLYFHQGRSSGKLWFGIRVALTDELIKLQQDLAGIIQPDYIVQGMGVRYFPHVTMGCSLTDNLPAISFAPETTMLEIIPCKLALGRSGPNLQFAEILYS